MRAMGLMRLIALTFSVSKRDFTDEQTIHRSLILIAHPMFERFLAQPFTEEHGTAWTRPNSGPA